MQKQLSVIMEEYFLEKDRYEEKKGKLCLENTPLKGF